MKKFLAHAPKILSLAVIGWVLSAHAAAADILGIGHIAGSVMYEVLASLVNIILHVVGYLLIVVGALLDISINMTMHIKSLVDSIPAIYQVWTTIRDISGLFFIFFLLYAAFKIILNRKDEYGHLLKDIVIAAILINFSFFITSVLIDASNMVSLAIYNSMLPNQEVSITNTTTIGYLVDNDRGHALSGAFMQGLSIPSLFSGDSKTDQAALAANDGSLTILFKIVLIGIIGVLTIIIAAFSFLFASIAFIVRLFILIFLLAFSPIWFAAWVIPELKQYAGKFTKLLQSQLIFMPVYLLLMYAALSIISTSNLFQATTTTAAAAGTGSQLPMSDYITLIINAVFIIFMLNLPLIGGLSIGGIVTGKGYGAGAISKWAGKKAGSWAGRNTVGRAASIMNNSETVRAFGARNPSLGIALTKQLSKVENAGFGEKKGSFKDVNDAKKKAYTDFHKNYVSKEMASEKFDDEKHTVGGAGFDHVTKDADGLTAYDRAKKGAKEAKQKRTTDYMEEIKKKGDDSTVIGFMLKGAASTTQKLAPAIVANAVNNATQSVMKSMNMGGVEAVKDLKKQQDNEKTKDAGKEAEARIKTMKEEQQKLTDEKKKLDEETKNSIEEAKREHSQKIQEAEKDLLDANTGIQQYQSSIDQRKIQADQLKVIIDASKNINNLQMAQNPNHISTTAAEEAQLQQLIDSTTEDEASLMALLHEKDATNNIIRDTKTALNTEITDISDRGKAERKAIEDKVTASKETVTKLQDAVKAMNKVLKDEKGGSLDGKFKDLEKEIKASKTP